METQELISSHSSDSEDSPASEDHLSAKDILCTAGKAVIVLFAIQGILASARELKETYMEWRHVRAAERRWKQLYQEDDKVLRQP